LEEKADKGFIKTGVAQFGVGLSLSPVNIVRHTNTNKAGVQEGKNAGMAPLAFRIVEHGVYCMPFFINPNFADKSGCTLDDVELLKRLIPYAYDLNRSAIRPDVRIRHAWYVEHKNALGSCPDYLILEALTPRRIGDADQPSSSWSDYEDREGPSPELLERVATFQDLMAL
jgi:CRISPR-associated protein Csd2